MKCNKKCMCSQNICLSNEMQQEMYVQSKYMFIEMQQEMYV